MRPYGGIVNDPAKARGLSCARIAAVATLSDRQPITPVQEAPQKPGIHERLGLEAPGIGGLLLAQRVAGVSADIQKDRGDAGLDEGVVAL